MVDLIMTKHEKFIRLRILGYHVEAVKALSHEGAIREFHFVRPEFCDQYSTTVGWSRARQVADYIYDAVTESFTKERSPLEAMPLTDTERVLYGE